ncbi:thioredoxin [bacterium]|nr:MAG: thioredoxin [bacterium]
MKTGRFPSLFAALCGILLFSGLSFADTLGDLARAAQKPLVADFGLKRCGQCIAQGKVIDELGAKIGDKVSFRFIHIKDEEKVVEEYKVLVVPTLIFFDAQGKEVFRNVGLMQADTITAKLRELGLLKK